MFTLISIYLVLGILYAAYMFMMAPQVVQERIKTEVESSTIKKTVFYTLMFGMLTIFWPFFILKVHERI